MAKKPTGGGKPPKPPKPPTPRDSGRGPSSIASKALRGERLTIAESKTLGASVLSQNQKP